MSADDILYIRSPLNTVLSDGIPRQQIQGAKGNQTRREQKFVAPHFGVSDESLLAKTSEGSREALGQLFRRYRRSVLNVASRILKDTSEAEDLCQEVFLLIFQKASSFDPTKGTASSWIVQIAYSRALNRKQYLSHRQHYTSQELNEEQLDGVRRSPFVDEVLAKSLLTKLREQLSEEQRYTLELYFFEGYSLREIAEKTGQTIGNVRHHYYRGLERLRSNVFSQKDS